MHPLAHHTGEQALLPLLLLAGTSVPAVMAIARGRLAALRTAGRRKPPRPGCRGR